MREYKVWFKLLAVVLSVLIGFQVAPVFAVALENGWPIYVLYNQISQTKDVFCTGEKHGVGRRPFSACG